MLLYRLVSLPIVLTSTRLLKDSAAVQTGQSAGCFDRYTTVEG